MLLHWVLMPSSAAVPWAEQHSGEEGKCTGSYRINQKILFMYFLLQLALWSLGWSSSQTWKLWEWLWWDTLSQLPYLFPWPMYTVWTSSTWSMVIPEFHIAQIPRWSAPSYFCTQCHHMSRLGADWATAIADSWRFPHAFSLVPGAKWLSKKAPMSSKHK